MHYSPFFIFLYGNIENKFFETDLKNEGMYNVYCTEVRSAPLIHFQKLFGNKVFYILELVRKFKSYIGMTISGSKRDKKCWKKPQIWFKIRFLKKKIGLAYSKYINTFNMMKKKMVSVYNFRTYFFPLCEVQNSFWNLLTTAIKYRIFFCDLF